MFKKRKFGLKCAEFDHGLNNCRTSYLNVFEHDQYVHSPYSVHIDP